MMFGLREQVTTTISQRLKVHQRQCKKRPPQQQQNTTKNNLQYINETVQTEDYDIKSDKEIKKEEFECETICLDSIENMQNSCELFSDVIKESLNSADANVNYSSMFKDNFFRHSMERALMERALTEDTISDDVNITTRHHIGYDSIVDNQKGNNVISTQQSIRYLALKQNELLVALTIGDHQVLAKVDTGASCSCMSQELADTLSRDIVRAPLQPQILSLADGTIQKVEEKVRISLFVGEKTIELSALVLPKIKNDLILGMDFLNVTEATFICGGQKIKFGQSKSAVISECETPTSPATTPTPSPATTPLVEESRSTENSMKIKKKFRLTEDLKEYQREYRKRNKELSRIYQRHYREYRKQNKEKLRKYQENYRKYKNKNNHEVKKKK